MPATRPALLLTTGALAGALTAALTGTATPAAASAPLLFGANAATRTLLQEHEAVLGRTMYGVRIYKTWDGQLFGSDQTWERDTGHTLFLSVRSQRSDGSIVSWAAIAAAQPGSALYATMQAQAQQLKAFGARVYVAFNHEPEARSAWPMGDGPQYVAAYRKVRSVWAAAGVTNVEYVFAATSYGFARTDVRKVANYYPGDAWVDDIAADPYNWFDCRPSDNGDWRPLSSIIEAQRRFGLQHPGKGLMLWEFASAEDPASPGRKASWLGAVSTLFSQPGYGQYKAVLYWDAGDTGGGQTCGFSYRSTATSQKAWGQLGRSAGMSARTVP